MGSLGWGLCSARRPAPRTEGRGQNPQTMRGPFPGAPSVCPSACPSARRGSASWKSRAPLNSQLNSPCSFPPCQPRLCPPTCLILLPGHPPFLVQHMSLSSTGTPTRCTVLRPASAGVQAPRLATAALSVATVDVVSAARRREPHPLWCFFGSVL